MTLQISCHLCIFCSSNLFILTMSRSTLVSSALMIPCKLLFLFLINLTTASSYSCTNIMAFLTLKNKGLFISKHLKKRVLYVKWKVCSFQNFDRYCVKYFYWNRSNPEWFPESKSILTILMFPSNLLFIVSLSLTSGNKPVFKASETLLQETSRTSSGNKNHKLYYIATNINLNFNKFLRFLSLKIITSI